MWVSVCSNVYAAFSPQKRRQIKLVIMQGRRRNTADTGRVSDPCLLDLMADNVDHDFLLLRLEHRFGLRDVALHWFRSYLFDKSFRALFGSGSQFLVQLVCSAPQSCVGTV